MYSMFEPIFYTRSGFWASGDRFLRWRSMLELLLLRGATCDLRHLRNNWRYVTNKCWKVDFRHNGDSFQFRRRCYASGDPFLVCVCYFLAIMSLFCNSGNSFYKSDSLLFTQKVDLRHRGRGVNFLFWKSILGLWGSVFSPRVCESNSCVWVKINSLRPKIYHQRP